MNMATRRSRSGDRERLSRDTIVAGAVALADAEGLDAVTIRRIANDHQVTPMALYWHFKDKGNCSTASPNASSPTSGSRRHPRSAVGRAAPASRGGRPRLRPRALL